MIDSSPWIRFSETPAAVVASAPEVGADNAAVYGELLGLGEAELDALRADGVI